MPFSHSPRHFQHSKSKHLPHNSAQTPPNTVSSLRIRLCVLHPPKVTHKIVLSSVHSTLRGYIQNIPDWCCHPYSSCGSAKHRSQQTKLWIPDSTAIFCGDCVKTCEDVAPNFGENRPACFTMTTPRLTLPSSPSSFWRNQNGCHPPTHRTPLIWHPVTSFYFQKLNFRLKGRWFDTIEEIKVESQRVLDTDRKVLPGSVPTMEETVGPLSTCGMELLRGWWRPIGLMVSFMIFTASVRNTLDTSS
jgi:hypothetical protein